MAGKLTIQQIRAVVLGLLVATALVTGGVYLHRTRGGAPSQPLPVPRVPPNVTQSTGFRLSKSDQGRTVFTVEALRAREQRDTGKSLLEDVEIITFGTPGNRHDRIFSKLCEYDAKTGRVYSEGEVEIELASLPGEVPPTASGLGRAPAPSVAGGEVPRIHVQTSGLTFDENTGVASTERLVRFRFSRGTGQARGAVYDSHQRTLRLTSAVQILVRDPGSPQSSEETPPSVEITAEELVYLQRESQIRLRQPRLHQMLAGGGSRDLLAEEAVLRLDEQNHVQAAEFVGQVEIHESVPGDKPAEGRQSRMTATRLELLFNDRQLLEEAYANETVQLEIANLTQPRPVPGGSPGDVLCRPAGHAVAGGLERRGANRIHTHLGGGSHPRAHQRSRGDVIEARRPRTGRGPDYGPRPAGIVTTREARRESAQPAWAACTDGRPVLDAVWRAEPATGVTRRAAGTVGIGPRDTCPGARGTRLAAASHPARRLPLGSPPATC